VLDGGWNLGRFRMGIYNIGQEGKQKFKQSSDFKRKSSFLIQKMKTTNGSIVHLIISWSWFANHQITHNFALWIDICNKQIYMPFCMKCFNILCSIQITWNLRILQRNKTLRVNPQSQYLRVPKIRKIIRISSHLI